jgi:hypothetical protein
MGFSLQCSLFSDSIRIHIGNILYAAVLKHREPTKVHGPVGQHIVVKALLVRHCQTGSAFEFKSNF